MRLVYRLIPLFLLVLVLGGVALAQNIADQGAPGNQGAWPVQTTGGSSSTTATSSVNARTPAATTTALTANGSACTTAGGASCTIVLASTEIIQWPNVTLTVRVSGAATVENVLVEFSPNNSNWEVWDSTTFANAASGSIRSLAIAGNSRRYIRVEARASVNSETTIYLTMNDG